MKRLKDNIMLIILCIVIIGFGIGIIIKLNLIQQDIEEFSKNTPTWQEIVDVRHEIEGIEQDTEAIRSYYLGN